MENVRGKEDKMYKFVFTMESDGEYGREHLCKASTLNEAKRNLEKQLPGAYLHVKSVSYLN